MSDSWIRKPSCDTTVVFVHGILSSNEQCWRHANGCFWPELLFRETSLTEVGIYVFEYLTSIFSAGYDLGDVVDALREQMKIDGVIISNHLVFVCHSMGGLVVRKFIVSNAVDLIDKKKTISLFLVASPSLGSQVADWLSPLALFLGNVQADVLRFVGNNYWLADLDREFLNLKEAKRLNINGKELVEDRFVVLRKFVRNQVVQPFSGARYFGNPIKIPASDHFSIAKPENSDNFQHRILIDFLKDSIKLKDESGYLSNLAPIKTSAPANLVACPNQELWKNPVDGSVLTRIRSSVFTMGNSRDTLLKTGYFTNPSVLPEWETHSVDLGEFWIALTPITFRQYRKFCTETGHKLPERHNDTNFNGDEQPVIGVSWYDAQEYLSWVGLDFPTEAEWERAAAGLDCRLFPWGNSLPTPDQCNHSRLRPGTWSVNLSINGSSDEGVCDLSGNVLEWCKDDLRDYPPDHVVSPTGRLDSEFAAVRGGSLARPPNQCRSSYRDRRRKSDSWGSTGLRPVFRGNPRNES